MRSPVIVEQKRNKSAPSSQAQAPFVVPQDTPSMPRALTQSDLIFPTQSLSVSSTLNSLKRSALSITNRLDSISSDSVFVSSVAEAYDLPLVANERCGSWYIPPEKKAEGVYFKSTDGHMNEWAFSLRRLNLQLVDVVGRSGGCVLLNFVGCGRKLTTMQMCGCRLDKAREK
jgi:tRNA A64-2'-O-ribosylphosphate transferase